MKTIDIKAIIEKQGLEMNDVAEQLFPKNKYPRLALNRVIAGDAVLDADQISKLALLADLTIAELYGANWKAKSSKGLHTFTNGEFKAELDTTSWITKIFHKGSKFHESVIHSKSIPLSEYLDKLNIQILKFKENESN